MCRHRLLLALLLCGMGSLTAPAGAVLRPVGAEPRLEVHVHQGLLTVRLHQAPWAAVLSELERHTGVQIVVRGSLPGTVTQVFEALPLEQGLRRLFRGANFLFVYGPGGQAGAAAATLRRIVAFPKEGSAAEEGWLPPATERSPAAAHPEARGAAEPMADVFSREEEPTAEGPPTAEADQETRLIALQALAQQGDVAALRQAAMHPDQTIQTTAIELLAERDPQGTVALLGEALQRAEPERRLQALHLLTAQGDEEAVRAALSAALGDEDVAVKRYAVQALAERGGSAPWRRYAWRSAIRIRPSG